MQGLPLTLLHGTKVYPSPTHPISKTLLIGEGDRGGTECSSGYMCLWNFFLENALDKYVYKHFISNIKLYDVHITCLHMIIRLI